MHFYDVGQGLSALVDLPDGRHLLVDTGDDDAHKHLEERLRADLHGQPIDLLWVTHQHADHNGGVPTLMAQFPIKRYVDNGTDGPKVKKGHKPEDQPAARARTAARSQKLALEVVDPQHRSVPWTSSGYTLSAVLPAAWKANCAEDPNDCSIPLRIDYCDSSLLFTGDAEAEEEALLTGLRHVDLLQVGHHGSDTSSSPKFVQALTPSYAVISAGKIGEGANAGYCHPRKITVTRLTELLGGAAEGRFIDAFEGPSCKEHQGTWEKIPASARLFATELDGDVVLETTGDGKFARVGAPDS